MSFLVGSFSAHALCYCREKKHAWADLTEDEGHEKS